MKVNPRHNGKNTTNVFLGLICFSWSINQLIIHLYKLINMADRWMKMNNSQCVKHYAKSVHIQIFLVRIFPHSEWIGRDREYLSVFSPNAGKYGPENLQIRTLFTQWYIYIYIMWNEKANHSANIAFKIKSQIFLKKIKCGKNKCNRFSSLWIRIFLPKIWSRLPTLLFYDKNKTETCKPGIFRFIAT